jgi:hypothetical protein
VAFPTGKEITPPKLVNISTLFFISILDPGEVPEIRGVTRYGTCNVNPPRFITVPFIDSPDKRKWAGTRRSPPSCITINKGTFAQLGMKQTKKVSNKLPRRRSGRGRNGM